MKRSILLAVAGFALLLLSYVPLSTAGSEAFDDEATAVVATDAAAKGQALFLAKGCATCHSHSGVEANSFQIGPNLSNYEPNPEFVREWLRDPGAIRPGTSMPNLELSEGEIDALIAFLQADDE